jgi:hypothetical protein
LFILIANRFNANRTRDARASGVTPTVTMTPSPTPAQQARRGFDFFGLFRRNTPTPAMAPVTPTPTLTFAQQMDSTMGQDRGQQLGANAQQGQQANGNVRNIPNTGTPTLVLPLASAAFALGLYLRRRK